MKEYQLSFGKILLLREDIAEVIVDEGIEMDTTMVDEYHQFLLSHLKAPFSLLVNKVHSYTYTFEAQSKLAELDEINVMAVVSYNKTTQSATQFLATFPREKPWNLEIFPDRLSALAWIEAKQRYITHTQ